MKNRYLREAITQAFQTLLSSHRSSKNMSIYEFSRKCGLSRQYLSLVESGKRVPAIDVALNMAQGFDMDTTDFMLMLIEKISYYEELYA